MSESIESIVQSYIRDIETETDTTVLLARDYGSHDAFLMDPNSDYDVAFVAAHPPKRHAYSDDLDSQFLFGLTSDDGTEFNFAGLSLSEFAKSLRNGDPRALTLVAAEMEYYQHPEVADGLAALFGHIRSTFSPPTFIAHFQKLAKSNYRYATEDDWTYHGGDQWTIEDRGSTQYLVHGLLGYPEKMSSMSVEAAMDEGILDHKAAEPTVQQNIRIARSLLSAQHIFMEGTVPPSSFEELVAQRRNTAEPVGPSAHSPLPDATADELLDLAARKRAGDGDDAVGLRIDEWATPIITSSEFHVGDHRIARTLDEFNGAVDPDRTPDAETINAHVDSILDTVY